MTEATTKTMPAAFIGHGSPMNALELNRWTGAWREFGASIPRPRAIAVVSAHWYINATAVTAAERPRTIHDFYGFPPELYDVQYPAPGAPDLVGEIIETAKPTWVGSDVDSWGIDHGTWSVLVHAFPDASIPVVQISIDATKPLDHHLDLGARLAALRASGVLLLGSGNVVHNLRAMDWSLGEEGFDWARSFDDSARDCLLERPEDTVGLSRHRHYDLASPTPDHFIPLLYVAGAAAADRSNEVDVLVQGHAYGSLSMTSYTVGAPRVETPELHGGPESTPSAPPEASNL